MSKWMPILHCSRKGMLITFEEHTTHMTHKCLIGSMKLDSGTIGPSVSVENTLDWGFFTDWGFFMDA